MKTRRIYRYALFFFFFFWGGGSVHIYLPLTSGRDFHSSSVTTCSWPPADVALGNTCDGWLVTWRCLCVCVCVCVCVCLCVCACVRACVCVCVSDGWRLVMVLQWLIN